MSIPNAAEKSGTGFSLQRSDSSGWAPGALQVAGPGSTGSGMRNRFRETGP